MTEEVKKLMAEALQHQVGPSFICGLALLLLARLIYRNRFSHFAAVLAFVGSLALGNFLGQLNPAWWPALTGIRRSTWLPWLATAGCLAGLFVRGLKMPLLGHGLWAATAAVAVTRIVPKDYLFEPLWAVPGFVLLTALVGFGFTKLNEKRPGGLVPFLFGFAMLTAGMIAIYADSKTLLDLNVLGGMCLYGIALVALFTKADVGAVYPGAAFLLTGSMFAVYHETSAELPKATYLLPGIAPLFALVGLIPFVDRRRPWLRVLLTAGPMLIVLGVAIYLAVANGKLPLGGEKEDW